MISDNCCSIEDCERHSDKVYCPNRFNFDEMSTLKVALQLAPGFLDSFVDYVNANNYDELPSSGKIMFDKASELTAKMEKLEEKIDNLIGMALINSDINTD